MYAGICWVAFKYPWLIHKPKEPLPKINKKTKKWIISHRGGSKERPENSLEAFRNANEKGCDMLELDVVCTKDRVVVVAHDNNLLRVHGLDQNITDLNFTELPPYLQKFETHFVDEPLEFLDKQYKICTLEQVFAEFPHLYMCVEIKEANEEAIEEVKKLVEKYQRADKTVRAI